MLPYLVKELSVNLVAMEETQLMKVKALKVAMALTEVVRDMGEYLPMFLLMCQNRISIKFIFLQKMLS